MPPAHYGLTHQPFSQTSLEHCTVDINEPEIIRNRARAQHQGLDRLHTAQYLPDSTFTSLASEASRRPCPQFRPRLSTQLFSKAVSHPKLVLSSSGLGTP